MLIKCRQLFHIHMEVVSIIIYTDADACPVKEEIDALAEARQIPSLFVHSYDHVSSKTYYSKAVMVDIGPEAVDMYIMNHIGKEDVAITQDHGLAALLLQKGAAVLSPKGRVFRKDEIDILLAGRYEGLLIKQGKLKKKGPPPLKAADKKHFKESFASFLEAGQSGAPE